MIADRGMIDIKHRVLAEVAKHAFEGDLEERRDFIPEELIPGPHPTYRCCIYKEREIIRYRIRLAEGKFLTPDDDNIIQVIEPACADCPISSYVVTDNCQNCLGKACVNSCKFGACTPGEKRSKIDAGLCKECGLCATACPYNAIAHLVRPCKNACPVGALSYNEDGISVIDPDKCVRCGQCIHRCPFGAIATKTHLVHVIEDIKAGKNVYLMVAPATEGQYGKGITIESFRKAAKACGFKDAYDVALGGDLTAAFEADEWTESFKEGKKLTTSCCPAFVNYIKMHFPNLLDKVSTTVSPMCAVSRMIKAMDPSAITVFLGPCVAKKSEAAEFGIEGNADHVMVYSEFEAILAAKGVDLEPEEGYTQEASVYGKRFANSGGVTAAVKKAMGEAGVEKEPNVFFANGGKECKIQLMLLEKGKFAPDFLEGMMCEGGCVGGPSAFRDAATAKKDRDEMIANADERGVRESIKTVNTNEFSMHRH